MSLENKIRIYKTCMKPVIIYAIETRVETIITEPFLNNDLKCIIGNILRDGIRKHP